MSKVVAQGFVVPARIDGLLKDRWSRQETGGAAPFVVAHSKLGVDTAH